MRVVPRDHIKTYRKFSLPLKTSLKSVVVQKMRTHECHCNQNVSLQTFPVLETAVFWSVTPFILVELHRRFRRTCYIYLQTAATTICAYRDGIRLILNTQRRQKPRPQIFVCGQNKTIIIIIRYVCLLSQAFLPGTSLEPAVIPTAQASSFTLQYFPYYVWWSKCSCLL